MIDATCGEVSVECGAANFELVNDVAGKWVVFGVLKHGFGMFDVLLVYSFWPTASAAAF